MDVTDGLRWTEGGMDGWVDGWLDACMHGCDDLRCCFVAALSAFGRYVLLGKPCFERFLSSRPRKFWTFLPRRGAGDP